MAGTTIATSLSTLLGGLNPTQLGRLGHHLTQSDEMRALQTISMMKQNPTVAPNLMASLAVIPNLPPQVTSWVSAAISNPANFQEDLTQAEAALQAAALQPGILGQLGL